jgi:hypothetical protein
MNANSKLIIKIFLINSLIFTLNFSLYSQYEWEPLIPKQYIINNPNNLLIIGDDRSGSTKRIDKLTLNDYKEIFTTIENNGGGFVYIFLIGNPMPESYTPLYVQIKPKSINIDKPAICSKYKIIACLEKVTKINKEINKNNELIINDNRTKINQILSEIDRKIIQYEYGSGKDLTNLDDVIDRINKKLNDITCNNPDINTSIALISDGWNEPKTDGITPLKKVLDLSNKNSKCIFIGWENDAYLKDNYINSKYRWFVSKTEFLQNLQDLILKNYKEDNY